MINELRDFKKEQATLTNELDQLKFQKSEFSDKLVNEHIFIFIFIFIFHFSFLESN